MEGPSEHRPVERATEAPPRLAFAALALFLVLFALVLHKPGWPWGLKADEPAYYLMALSLAYDGDLLCDLQDTRRLFDEFPFAPVRNLILASDDGWQTIYFGKPYLYSLFAAPAAWLFGASGMVAFNLVLLLAMVWLGARYLGRFNSGATATLFSTGFFLLSAGFAYGFWIHPEVFNMAAITACLYLGLSLPSERRFGAAGWRRTLARLVWRQPLVRAALSGAALAPAVYNKPMLAALGLPVLFLMGRERRFRAAALWLAGAAAAMGLAVGINLALTGHPSAYLGSVRGGYLVCAPGEMPIRPDREEQDAEAETLPENATQPAAKTADEAGSGAVAAAAPSAEEEAPATGEIDGEVDGEIDGEVDGETAEDPEPLRSWFWIFRVPRFNPPEVLEQLGYFLWGRHTGLFPYFPFAGLALILFLVHGRRSAVRWTVVASLAVVALFFLLWIPFNWHGGGGFVGNRYFVNAYPAFLFLVTRIRPRWISVVGFALGGLLLGPTIFSPTGRSVPWPTLQAHVRNFPFTRLPFELGVKGVPGYLTETWADLRVTGRRDVFLPRGAQAWVHGATETEIWLRSPEPLASVVLGVRSFAVPNDIVLSLGKSEERLAIRAPEDRRQRVVLAPGGPDRILHSSAGDESAETFAYRLVVTTSTGEVRLWTQHYPPGSCPGFPWVESTEESFYAGARLSFLGTAERLARELYEVEWGAVRAPKRVGAGRTFQVFTRVRNASSETWPSSPPTRVHLSYRWETTDGEAVVGDGLRSVPKKDTEPGAWLALRQEVQAPDKPGSYVLVLDPVFEEVAWFSSRNGGQVYRTEVEVVQRGRRSL